MRGVYIVIILLLLAGCSVEPDVEPVDVSQFNRIQMIDFPYEEVDARELESLHQSYTNEQKAMAMYRKALDLFPEAQPFESIILKQELEVSLLDEIYAKYEFVHPEGNWYANVSRFSSPQQACYAGITFAEESIIFYEDWLDNEGLNYKVNNQDLRFVYEKLRNDYRDVLIPTFKRCGRGLL